MTDTAAEIERLSELIRLLRNQLLSECFRGLHPSPAALKRMAREWDDETEQLIVGEKARR